MSNQELEDLLTLGRWDQVRSAEQAEVAAAVAARLSGPFRFTGLEDYELGQQRHRVACFTWNEARFALIPGGPATLGYAPGSFRATEVQQQSWEETCRTNPKIAQEFPRLDSYLEYRLTPLRQVTLQPFLLQVEAEEVELRLERGRRRHPALTIPLTAAQIQAYIAKDGCRLPTSDEWEYACAAGARTLWRWGDEIPMILVPSRKNLPDWDLHLRPNAFGLLMGDHPSHWEFTAEEGVLRGGDGGTASNAGPGRLMEWLILASSYWKPLNPRLRVPRVFIRRAYSLFN
jgi:hypothetical protein